MKCGILLVGLLLSGCAVPSEVSSESLVHNDSSVCVGMLLEMAQTKLAEHGAQPTMLQVALRSDGAQDEPELCYYRLASGAVMEIVSKATLSGRVVGSISVSTYAPRSWSSKVDPEWEKFFQSFVNYRVYDLETEAEPGATDNPGDAQRSREDH